MEVNGRPLKEVASRFKKLSTTVPQDDTLLSSLTPRETLTFAARLRLPMSLTGAEKRQRVAMYVCSRCLINLWVFNVVDVHTHKTKAPD